MKETNAERLKREKDGLAVWADIERYSQTGFQAIDPDDMDRFKWYGLYTQRPAEEGFFMLRIKAPNGVLDATQLETIGWISQVHGRSTGDITTRQGIQFHYIKIEDVPHIIAELNKVGLTTQEACGDVVRNVVGCPVTGIDGHELFDTSELAHQLTQKFLYDPAYSNLPRKFKISISGCLPRCAQQEINDIGFVAVKRGEEVGFDLTVGGGLGARPYLAKRLGAFVRPDEVIEVTTHVVEIFRDLGYREDRRRARLKFLVADWGAEKFRAELERRLGRQLLDYSPENEAQTPHQRDHLGIVAQREPGLHYVGVVVTRGRISGPQMTAVAGLARRYGNGRIRLTNSQNLILPDVPTENLAALQAQLRALDLHVEASAFRKGTVSCTGRQFCKLAVVETKTRAADIIHHLEYALPDFRDDLRISVTGCTNSCAQYQIADIGLVGVKGKENGEEVDFFQIHLGGRLGRDAAFGRKLSKRVRAEETKFYLERLIRGFRAQRHDGELFHQFIARHDAKELERLDETQHIALAKGVAV